MPNKKIQKIKKCVVNSSRTYRRAFFILLAFIVIVFFSAIYGPFRKSQPSPSPTSSTEAGYSDFHLLIPSINIVAPIITSVDGGDKASYDKALENGVAQLQGSSLPGEGSNIFIFGHSSYYWWKPGEYKTIFSHLPRIKENDEIILWYHQKEFKYKVTQIKTVLPNQVDVVEKTPNEQLSLMTCVPVGTDQKRLIVIAKPE